MLISFLEKSKIFQNYPEAVELAYDEESTCWAIKAAQVGAAFLAVQEGCGRITRASDYPALWRRAEREELS